MVFPVVMYGCEIWTIKKAECQRIDAFELWCWRGLLRVSWISRRSNLDEINPEYSLEGPMVKLKLQYVGHLIWRADSLEKTQMLVKIEGWRQKEEGMTEEEMIGWYHCLNGHEFEQALGDSEGQGGLHAACREVTKSRTRLSDWTTTKANESKENFIFCSLLFSSTLNSAWNLLESINICEMSNKIMND